jgi:extracellular factor (EF) 3-hydroxypalmitic acid methyl ester biosynthesis protein
MSQILNISDPGNGNGSHGLLSQLKTKPEPVAVPAPRSEAGEARVVFQTADGAGLRGTPLRITRHTVVFELFEPVSPPQFSEALEDFKIILQERTSYAGRAVINKVLNTGLRTVCEATLDEISWLDPAFVAGKPGSARLREEFKGFIREWQKSYRVSQDYKVVVADLQTFLNDLRLWLDRVELGLRSSSAAGRARLETGVADDLREPVLSALTSLFERFEAVSDAVAEDLRPAHRAFGRRQLLPYFLCAPFFHRTYTKPLGYAGDHEMMSMIVRNGLEGETLYARLVNAYLLNHAPCRAVRNRVGFLKQKIIEETGRVARTGGAANIFSLGCGPAWEAVNFLDEHPLARHARFQLLDFNEEALEFAGGKIDAVKKKRSLATPVRLVRNSVQNLLRGHRQPGMDSEGYDLIYCSGLYDYLTDRVCLALNNHLYGRLRPGGLMVIGNFGPATPGRNLMEHLMDWFLIYRDQNELAALAPEPAAKENCLVRAEAAGANLFLEVRKPA